MQQLSRDVSPWPESNGAGGSRMTVLALALAAAVHVAALAAFDGVFESTRPMAPKTYEVAVLAPALPPPPPALDPPPETPPPEPSMPETPPPAEPVPTKRVPRTPRATPPAAPEVAPGGEPKPLRFDASQTGGSSTVVVPTGRPSDGTEAGAGKGDHRGRGDGSGGGTGDTTVSPPAPGGAGPSWSPTSAAFIDTLPIPISVERRTCPASRDRGVAGTVVLRVQVRSSGHVRRVTLLDGIGNGCDEIAIEALRRARFRPATTLDGRSADYELRYEYVFAVS